MSRAGDTGYTQKGLAESRYKHLERTRQPFLDEARKCSALTIPWVCPPWSYRTKRVALPKPNQGLGARGVSNLCGKILTVLMPPGMPFFKVGLQPKVENDLTRSQDGLGPVLEALSKHEMDIVTAIAQDGDRAGISMGFLGLPITGNTLLHDLPKGGTRYFGLDQFVVRRGPDGKTLEIIVVEATEYGALHRDHQEQLGIKDAETRMDETDVVDVYTRIYLDEATGRYHEFQEAKGMVLEGSDGEYPADALPWHPLRWSYVAGEDYGRGLIELHFKDLERYDGLSKAIGDAAKNAAKLIWMTSGGGSGALIAKLSKAESGDFIAGNADNIKALQQEKANDLQIAFKEKEDLQQKLSMVFLLGSSIQRSGERVTKFEVEYQARELESAYSNEYTILGREFQLPYFQAKTAQLRKRGVIARLPSAAIKVAITTGIDALGRGSDQQALETLVGVAGEVAKMDDSLIHRREVMRRSAANLGIKSDGLIPTDEEVQAQEQKSQMNQIGQSVAPEVARGIAQGALQRQQATLDQQQPPPQQLGASPTPPTPGVQ